MYESFYGLKEKPFSMLPDPGFLYLSKKHQKALTLFEYGLMNNAGFSVISGEIGSGKTTLLRKLLENMDRRITGGMITNTHQGFGELLDWVLSAFDIHEKGLSQVEKHQRFMDFLIEQYASKKTTLLIVDEAQNMAADKLEELRMLSNVNSEKDQVLRIILAGQPELKDTLHLPELMQFVQRISVDYHLGSLDEEDTCAYIAHRISVAGAEEAVFTEAASKLIYKYSGGTPRLINLLCDTAMVYGFADQQTVIDEDLVAEMIIERMENSLVPLACSEPPKKKAKKLIIAEPVVEQVDVPKNTDSDTAEPDTAEHDFGEKVLQAVASENEAKPDEAEQPEIKSIEIEEEISEDEEIISEPDTFAKQHVIDRFSFMNSVLLGVVVLFVIFLLISSATEEDAEMTVPVIEEPEPVISPVEPVQQLNDQPAVQSIPDEVKNQLDEAKKAEQEMLRRQQEDEARMKALQEKAAKLQSERDRALARAQAEQEKRAAEAEAARLAEEREQEAQKVAEQAKAAAQAEAEKTKRLEELRAREKQESEAALQVQQEKLDAVVGSVEVPASETELKKEEAEIPEDDRCQGPAARFLSICR
ncbi:MAG: AAA family ATPase [Gammaproteobacteria bacterium]|nr:AAA family ATPase [Gammaproteobacteria bacterium]